MIKALTGVFKRRSIDRFNPPKGKHRLSGRFEKFVFTDINVAMNREDECPKRFCRFPYAHIDVHGRVARPMQGHGAIPNAILQSPDEAWHALRQGVDAGFKMVGEWRAVAGFGWRETGPKTFTPAPSASGAASPKAAQS